MSRILIVDDSPTLRKMVMAALRPLKATFGEAGSGLEAIEQLSLSNYDAMTLDLNMPDMHGFEVLAFIRAHAAYQALPVVVLSTRSDTDTRQEALQAGASAYLTKPFAPAEFLAAVRGLVPA